MNPAHLIGALLVAAVAYFPLLYLLVFWRIWRHQRVPVHQRYEEFGVAGVTVSSSTWTALTARTQELAALGFELRGMLVNKGFAGVSMVHVVHGRPDGRVSASVLAAVRGGQANRFGVGMWRVAPPSSWLLRVRARMRSQRLLDAIEKTDFRNWP